MKLLVIEDDAKTAQAICKGLGGEGYETSIAKTGEEGLLSAESFDIIILDWMLPGRDGIEILKALRTRGNKSPVVLLTARDAVEDRVLGLDSGADDYLVKPFALPNCWPESGPCRDGPVPQNHRSSPIWSWMFRHAV